jgi:hypothetical protein
VVIVQDGAARSVYVPVCTAVRFAGVIAASGEAHNNSESISKRITNKIPDFFTRAVDVKASEETDSQVDHEPASRYPTRSAKDYDDRTD